MPLPLLLDSGILAKAVRPAVPENKAIAIALSRLAQDVRYKVCIPEIADYGLRRKLLHLGHHPHQARKWAQEALTLLDGLISTSYIPITTDTMRLAAGIWAHTRAKGQLRASEDKLDIDVILAAQARQSGGKIITTNEKHFRNIADVFDWTPFQPS
jgi:predicted nucleic acid-binding protein